MQNPDLKFDRNFEAPYGQTVRVSDLVHRLLAPNPGPFTYRGTSATIVGSDQVVVIDPGPDDPAHLRALHDALRGKAVTHILVTHTHRDHSPAARPLQEWCGAPTCGFGPHARGDTGAGEEGADAKFVPDLILHDGDVIAGKQFTIECVHTPGHTSNHLCYWLKEENALFSGDHVMGWSTTVVAPPDGDMGAYMRSLEKLLLRNDGVYWPAHGGAIRNPKSFVSALLQHRIQREEQIFSAVENGVERIPALANRVYAGLDPRLTRAAELNVLAHVLKLVREGKLVRQGTEYAGRYLVGNDEKMGRLGETCRPK